METQHNAPLPYEDETPTVYADRVGQWYASLVSPSHKKTFGQYLTPVEIAMFMARLFHPEHRTQVRALDPGAGTGILSCALCEALAYQADAPKEIVLEAYETDAQLALHLVKCLSYLKKWLKGHGVILHFKVSTDDFVMKLSEALDTRPRLFPTLHTDTDTFDVAISNPPYFKIPKSDPRAKAAALVVHGQPNIYALFMAVSSSLLKPGGQFISLIHAVTRSAAMMFCKRMLFSLRDVWMAGPSVRMGKQSRYLVVEEYGISQIRTRATFQSRRSWILPPKTRYSEFQWPLGMITAHA